MSRPRFLVLGAGAMGLLFGGRLAAAGHEVTFIGRPLMVAALAKQGLLLTGETRTHQQVQAFESLAKLPEDYTTDFILVTVKSYASARAAEELARWRGLTRQTCVVSLQNGLDNMAVLAVRLPGHKLVGGLTSHGATLVDWGEVNHAGVGYTVVGGYTASSSSVAAELAKAFETAGIETRLSNNLEGEIWAKGIVNCAINPVAALSGRPNGALGDGPLRELAQRACHEATTVARAKGVKLPVKDPWELVNRVIEQTRTNRCSMLQDVERGRATEIEAINGVIVREGQALDLPVGVNETLMTLILGLSES